MLMEQDPVLGLFIMGVLLVPSGDYVASTALNQRCSPRSANSLVLVPYGNQITSEEGLVLFVPTVRGETLSPENRMSGAGRRRGATGLGGEMVMVIGVTSPSTDSPTTISLEPLPLRPPV